MDFESIRTVISITGCIQLYRSSHPGHFIVMEQKLTDDFVFTPLENGAYVFFIRPGEKEAEKRELFNLKQIFDFLTQSLDDGWRLDEEMTIDIPKKNPWKKWQLNRLL